MDAASEVVTVPASSAATTTTIQTSTNTINVNQSNNNNLHTHTNTHSGSNNLTNSTSSNINSSSNISLSIGGNSSSNSSSSNSNSNCSSSSTSSNSSGYGSTTTTPTNNYDLQQTTPTTTPIPTTPVAIAEPIIPVATVAAVTPFYNESITTHNLETHHVQHHHHSAQEDQQHMQQQHHLLQPNHHQLQQNHLQTNLQQQHHQFLSRQQYYSPYDYQQTAPTHNLSNSSAPPNVAPFNVGIAGPYEMSSPALNSSYGAGQYKSASLSGTFNYERGTAGRSNAPPPTYNPQQQQPQQQSEQQQPKPVQQHGQHFSIGVITSSKQRSSSLIGNSTSANTSKPQAAATPFYAQPLSQTHSNPTPFYDNLKHKMPLEYHDTYVNPTAATAASYHQQQKYYAAAKSLLKEATYGSPAALNSKSLYPNSGNYFPGPTSSLGLTPTSYEKYMYPHAPATAYSTTGHLSNETLPEVNSYRKPVVGSSMNSPAWPWGIDYSSGNSRTIPPPASHLPTATVAPTHATYLTPNPSALSRDPYYMGHDKYGVKYDKYAAPSYQQSYVSPSANRHHLWANAPHTSNLTQLNERHLLSTAPTAPSAHGLHSTPYLSNNSTTGLNSRQSCCSQPYQPQSCYYPPSHPVPPRLPHSQNPTVPAPGSGYLSAQPSLGQSPHLNALSASCKYGGVLPDFGNGNNIKNSNDLYLNTHQYNNTLPPHNFGFGSDHNSQQLYTNNEHQPMAHGHNTPASSLTHDPLNANVTSYTNDLSLTTNNFDNFHTHLDTHPSPTPFTGIHSQQPPPAYGPTVAKRALLEYRKPIQHQLPPTVADESFNTLASRNHYIQHQELLNTPETTTTFGEYEVHEDNPSTLSYAHRTEVLDETDKSGDESNKNLSLRDFIANWNDDEDDYQNNDEMNFDQNTVIDEVLQTASVEQDVANVASEEIESIKNEGNFTDSQNGNETIGPSLNDTVDNQYVNLPDIVIDIEKSNNINSSITTPLTSPTPPPLPLPKHDVANSSLNLSNFDVEKELDELKLKKPVQQELTKDLNDNTNSKSVTTPQLSPCKNLSNQFSFEDLNLEPAKKTVLNAITTRLTNNHSADLSEQYFKDIEDYESSSSRHSNESAFEKEYETFINKITSESVTNESSKENVLDAEKEIDFEQNVKDFSKFYKRKRKLKEDELKSAEAGNLSQKKSKTNLAIKVNNSNFPRVYTKKSRNRLNKVKQQSPHKRKPISMYYKIIHSIRRLGPYRAKRVREFMSELKEKHLPLIKRQSIKNYTHDVTKSLFNAKSLKALCIMAINTEEFRQILMLSLEEKQDSCLESEERHICTDPSCETCEVIKSLMEVESFEGTLMQQTAKSNEENIPIATTILCVGDNNEPIVILEDGADIVDLSFRNEEHITISNESENVQYSGESITLFDTYAQKQSPLNSPDDQTNLTAQADFKDLEQHVKRPEIEADLKNDNLQSKETEDSLNEPNNVNRENAVDPEPVSSEKTSNNFKDSEFPTSFEQDQPSKTTEITYTEAHAKKCLSKQAAENESEDSDSSESESDSSFSSSEDTSKSSKSNSESSETDVESDLDNDNEMGSSNLKQLHHSENMKSKPIRTSEERQKVTKPTENCKASPASLEDKRESSNNSNKIQRGHKKTEMQVNIHKEGESADEKISRSPQRIVIRITKSLSSNDQTLRVENVFRKSLESQAEIENHTKSESEDGAVTEKKLAPITLKLSPKQKCTIEKCNSVQLTESHDESESDDDDSSQNNIPSPSVPMDDQSSDKSYTESESEDGDILEETSQINLESLKWGPNKKDSIAPKSSEESRSQLNNDESKLEDEDRLNMKFNNSSTTLKLSSKLECDSESRIEDPVALQKSSFTISTSFQFSPKTGGSKEVVPLEKFLETNAQSNNNTEIEAEVKESMSKKMSQDIFKCSTLSPEPEDTSNVQPSKKSLDTCHEFNVFKDSKSEEISSSKQENIVIASEKSKELHNEKDFKLNSIFESSSEKITKPLVLSSIKKDFKEVQDLKNYENDDDISMEKSEINLSSLKITPFKEDNKVINSPQKSSKPYDELENITENQSRNDEYVTSEVNKVLFKELKNPEARKSKKNDLYKFPENKVNINAEDNHSDISPPDRNAKDILNQTYVPHNKERVSKSSSPVHTEIYCLSDSESEDGVDIDKEIHSKNDEVILLDSESSSYSEYETDNSDAIMEPIIKSNGAMSAVRSNEESIYNSDVSKEVLKPTNTLSRFFNDSVYQLDSDTGCSDSDDSEGSLADHKDTAILKSNDKSISSKSYIDLKQVREELKGKEDLYPTSQDSNQNTFLVSESFGDNEVSNFPNKRLKQNNEKPADLRSLNSVKINYIKPLDDEDNLSEYASSTEDSDSEIDDISDVDPEIETKERLKKSEFLLKVVKEMEFLKSDKNKESAPLENSENSKTPKIVAIINTPKDDQSKSLNDYFSEQYQSPRFLRTEHKLLEEPETVTEDLHLIKLKMSDQITENKEFKSVSGKKLNHLNTSTEIIEKDMSKEPVNEIYNTENELLKNVETNSESEICRTPNRDQDMWSDGNDQDNFDHNDSKKFEIFKESNKVITEVTSEQTENHTKAICEYLSSTKEIILKNKEILDINTSEESDTYSEAIFEKSKLLDSKAATSETYLLETTHFEALGTDENQSADNSKTEECEAVSEDAKDLKDTIVKPIIGKSETLSETTIDMSSMSSTIPKEPSEALKELCDKNKLDREVVDINPNVFLEIQEKDINEILSEQLSDLKDVTTKEDTAVVVEEMTELSCEYQSSVILKTYNTWTLQEDLETSKQTMPKISDNLEFKRAENSEVISELKDTTSDTVKQAIIISDALTENSKLQKELNIPTLKIVEEKYKQSKNFETPQESDPKKNVDDVINQQNMEAPNETSRVLKIDSVDVLPTAEHTLTTNKCSKENLKSFHQIETIEKTLTEDLDKSSEVEREDLKPFVQIETTDKTLTEDLEKSSEVEREDLKSFDQIEATDKTLPEDLKKSSEVGREDLIKPFVQIEMTDKTLTEDLEKSSEVEREDLKSFDQIEATGKILTENFETSSEVERVDLKSFDQIETLAEDLEKSSEVEREDLKPSDQMETLAEDLKKSSEVEREDLRPFDQIEKTNKTLNEDLEKSSEVERKDVKPFDQIKTTDKTLAEDLKKSSEVEREGLKQFNQVEREDLKPSDQIETTDKTLTEDLKKSSEVEREDLKPFDQVETLTEDSEKCSEAEREYLKPFNLIQTADKTLAEDLEKSSEVDKEDLKQFDQVETIDKTITEDLEKSTGVEKEDLKPFDQIKTLVEDLEKSSEVEREDLKPSDQMETTDKTLTEDLKKSSEVEIEYLKPFDQIENSGKTLTKDLEKSSEDNREDLKPFDQIETTDKTLIEDLEKSSEVDKEDLKQFDQVETIDKTITEDLEKSTEVEKEDLKPFDQIETLVEDLEKSSEVEREDLKPSDQIETTDKTLTEDLKKSSEVEREDLKPFDQVETLTEDSEKCLEAEREYLKPFDEIETSDKTLTKDLEKSSEVNREDLKPFDQIETTDKALIEDLEKSSQVEREEPKPFDQIESLEVENGFEEHIEVLETIQEEGDAEHQSLDDLKENSNCLFKNNVKYSNNELDVDHKIQTEPPNVEEDTIETPLSLTEVEKFVSEKTLMEDQPSIKHRLENSNHSLNETSCEILINKERVTPDFLGFKNQSSFEDESEDFHGFEDMEEVTRIRQEIENLNDDSAANDGFLNNPTLSRELHKSSTTSLTSNSSSEINELEALEKEISQHQSEIEVGGEEKKTDNVFPMKNVHEVSSNDIEHIKQMLESDEELQTDGEDRKETLTDECKNKSLENNKNIANDIISSVNSIIPKLSDLCRAALNSSLNSNTNSAQQHTATSTLIVERELSVEEAFAEMYRQAGILLSDPEDCDNDAPSPGNNEAHDVLLINLQEILNSDNNDVYVLQCDMNENVLNVVQSAREECNGEQQDIDAASTERVNTVQIILDTQNNEPQIHIISSDSESEVIILSDDDSDLNCEPFIARSERVTIPFINDNDEMNVSDSLSDISTIHHEEIVPENLNKFLQEEFYKYLHEKYVQRYISKYYHANRVLKKYKKRFLKNKKAVEWRTI